MKTTTSVFNKIAENDLKNLTNVVKETLAVNYRENKVFSAAELWNIQKRSRTLTSRRSRF